MLFAHSLRYIRRRTPWAHRDVATAALGRFESDTQVDFSKFSSKIGTLRRRLKRPLTYAEKVLYNHLDDEFDGNIVRGQTQLRSKPVRIACQDATAQMALIQDCPKDIGCATSRRVVALGIAERHINELAGIISVKGSTGSIIEYFGLGAQTISATGMATVCNMGAESGATTSIFPYTASMAEYLRANRRPDMAAAVETIAYELRSDEGAEYDQIIDIDLSSLEPHIDGPFTPDLSTPISKFGSAVIDNEWPSTLTAGLIGSCTNSSFHDLSRALLLSPGSLQTRNTLEEAGIMQVFEKAGAIMLPNACGPCCGSWDRTDIQKVSLT
ncbi:hypothetical protein AN7642.2 [Aspergillus nidulans FGSC A4]|uniref:Aconitate hydratase, hypothetical (Eurofung) n=1 Tax=Emericella nidulans (strain FGSC A4 / ATCC 38163 / CBS 112.46 / NRRL 194 / M139) TaxID=227321 RepID=Q5AVN8_EMENI|nr:hypothetical protein [Aspergillus nidulans FGSC A4]EAA61828.1 hypothetical protein AN7642.2 [Aspergillus nidulans FGSC A4]CBF79802.1 TPA: aconitate hydratase, hypothetical (Eurofung) [Aspergillus nidulans FGSC A4]|eukprot:XP_680911.1 hypothetical protein AN7642.2 [Aspergillus nidulans FGSC A4]